MKKILIGVIALGLLLAGCSKDQPAEADPKLTAKEMADSMLEEVEQPELIELEPEQVKNLYNLDSEMLEDYSIRIPMMNVKTNEMAILKVKDEKDIPKAESAVKQRAENVKKQFETYLPDQYENAKNYKLMTKGKYVLFVISEDADKLVNVYNSFFEEK